MSSKIILPYTIIFIIFRYCNIISAFKLILCNNDMYNDLINMNIYKYLLKIHLPNFETINKKTICYNSSNIYSSLISNNKTEKTLSDFESQSNIYKNLLFNYIKINSEFDELYYLFLKINKYICKFIQNQANKNTNGNLNLLKEDIILNMCIKNIYQDKIKIFLFQNKNYLQIKNLDKLLHELIHLKYKLPISQINILSTSFIPFKEILDFCFTQNSCIWNNIFISENIICCIINDILYTYIEPYLDILNVNFNYIINNFCNIFSHPNLTYNSKIKYLNLLLTDNNILGGMGYISEKYHCFQIRLINTLLSSNQLYKILKSNDSKIISDNIIRLIDIFKQKLNNYLNILTYVDYNMININNYEIIIFMEIYTEHILSLIYATLLNSENYEKLKIELTLINNHTIKNYKIIVNIIILILKLIYNNDLNLTILNQNNHPILYNLFKFYIDYIKKLLLENTNFKNKYKIFCKYLKSSIINDLIINIAFHESDKNINNFSQKYNSFNYKSSKYNPSINENCEFIYKYIKNQLSIN
jgi:hypothetical protein